MFRQASNRYKRSKGFKVKHAFQIALLVAVSIWLLYQVKHSHDKRQAHKNANAKVENNDENANGWNSDAFGRKGKVEVSHEVPETPHGVKNEGNAEEEEGGEETKDSQNKSEENGNEDRGVGDDEIDRHDGGKTEEDEKQNEHEEKFEEENQHGHEEKVGEDENENENEHEKVIDSGLKGEETKEADMEDGEQGGDVGANFIRIKQDIESGEESRQIANEQHNQEETPEDEKVEQQSENEQGDAPPLGPAEGKMGNNSVESEETFGVVPEQNKTATASPSPSEESIEEKLSGSNKTEETDLKKSETTLVDTSKDVLTLDPNAEMEGEKLKEEEKTPNVTLIEDHHGKDTIEDHQTETGQNDMARHEPETKSLDETATSGSMNETVHGNKTDKEDNEIVSSLDQNKAKNGTEPFDKTEAKDVGSTDQNVTNTGKNPTANATAESAQTYDGDTSSQDIPVENEGSNRADLETLPQTEVDVQNSEELSVQ